MAAEQTTLTFPKGTATRFRSVARREGFRYGRMLDSLVRGWSLLRPADRARAAGFDADRGDASPSIHGDRECPSDSADGGSITAPSFEGPATSDG